jgi:cell division protein FtsI/penicillin-binding protein 2
MNSNSVTRVRIILAFFCIWAVVLGAKLYWIQIVKGKEYAAQADAQYVKPSSLTFERGTIFFSTKGGERVSAATQKEGYILSMNPVLLGDPAVAYEALSQYIKLDRDTFFAKAAKEDPYEELAKKVDRDTGISIAELNLPGIMVNRQNWRIYPGGELAAHTIGLVGYNDANELAGRYGLERFYEKTLNHTNYVSVNFFAELFADIRGSVSGDELDQGRPGDIVAHIDPTVESELEKVIVETQKQWQSDAIGGIIMDPKTGKIYGMAARPSFDPNNLKEVSDPRLFSNPLVENVYEMGSIMKPLTMAAGIDSKAVEPDTIYDDTGFMELNGKRIANYDGRARGRVSMQEVLSQSLNIGAATIALKVGKEDFRRYFLSFGLGGLTGIDQPNEQKGIVENLKSGRDIEIATASYGQGIAISPITMTRALSILANGGVLVRPTIAKEIEYLDGSRRTIEPASPVRVIQKETAEDVTRMLVEVVDKAISKAHPEIKMQHYSIAAKTGTAQIADRENGGYYGDRYLHSFFGYFPAYNPRFIIFLYQLYPKGAEFASQTLTDPFTKLAKFLITYYEIPPDR